METGTLISLGLYFLLMLGIGFYAFRTSTSDTSEYMLGGRKLHPAVAALSAGASDMSGWILMGLPGAAFATGLAFNNGFSTSFLLLGLMIGALSNYLLVAPRLRVYTEAADDALTIPDYFAKRFDDQTHMLRILSSFVIVIFFTLYTSAGVVAGGKLFESAFELDYAYGLWVTTGVVVAYTFAGGFLAVSLTDFVQGCIMFVALILVPIVTIMGVGDPGENSILETARFDPLAGFTLLGVISSMAWGLGYFGQPHIIVRFMAIKSVKDVPAARNIGMSWMLVTLLGATTTGLFGAIYAAQNGLEITDGETIFIVLSQVLFHPLIAGFMLAAILAAVMSTISSQLLVASSSLTEDFYKLFVRRHANQKELVLVGRLCVVGVALIAILLAYDRSSSILDLVGNAWAGFGAAFGPVVILSLHWKRMTMPAAFLGILVGAATVIIWTYTDLVPSPIGDVYSMVPGFILCWLTVFVTSLVTNPKSGIIDRHQAIDAEMKG